MLTVQPLACDIDIEIRQASAADDCFRQQNSKSQPQSSTKNDDPHPQPLSIEAAASQSNKSQSKHPSEQSGPISIPRSEHRLAPKVAETVKTVAPLAPAAPVEYLPDGTKIEFEINEFQEYMPILPKIARPKNTMRQNTRPPGTCKWNLVTGCWTNIDHNTSRGTWGCFRDKRKLIRRPEDCEPGDLGLFAVEPITQVTDTVVTDQNKIQIASDAISHSDAENPISTDAKKEDGAEAAVNIMTLGQLRELAMENEDAFESYVPSLGDQIVKRNRLAYGPGACP